MNISICITTLNEEKSIAPLLDSLIAQSKKADEIVVVDGGSKDRTLEIIKHYQKKVRKIKLLVEKCSRSKGRNLGVEVAKNEIIAMTDAGCVPNHDWLENLTQPFENEQVGVSAGFYNMVGDTSLQKAESIFLGIIPSKFDIDFLPSTRSMAFRKSVWLFVGGFPESLEDTAEDTVFNYKLLKNGVKIVRVKNAIVEWGMPESLSEFYWKIHKYAEGDVKSKIWIFPGKSLTSHNVKSLFIIFRYIIGITLLTYSFKFPLLLPFLVILFLFYLTWAFRKVYLEERKAEVSLWGPVLQITSDFAVMGGFISGLLRR